MKLYHNNDRVMNYPTMKWQTLKISQLILVAPDCPMYAFVHSRAWTSSKLTERMMESTMRKIKTSFCSRRWKLKYAKKYGWRVQRGRAFETRKLINWILACKSATICCKTWTEVRWKRKWEKEIEMRKGKSTGVGKKYSQSLKFDKTNF